MANNDKDDLMTDSVNSNTTRRRVLKSSGVAAGAALFGAGAVQGGGEAKTGDEASTDRANVTVSEGTNIAPTVSPDGESIVFDLHGILFSLSKDGGKAEQLTEVELEPARPDYSPDGTRIAFQGYADGDFDIWTAASDGSDIQQLTDDYWDDREPKWSPDGSQIAFSSDRGGDGYNIWTIDVASGDLHQWTDDDMENYEPTWSPDGSEVAYVASVGEYAEDASDSVEKIKAIGQSGDSRTLITADAGETLYSPSWSLEGDGIAYVRMTTGESDLDAGEIDLMLSDEQLTDGEDVFVFTPRWLSADELLYGADGAIRERNISSGETSDIPFKATFEVPGLDYEHKSYDFDERGSQDVQGILTPALSPDGEHVAFVALNDLWVMRIGRSPRPITDDPFYKTDPAWSPDGRYVAYSSDKDGTQDIYAYDTEAGDTQRMTALDDAAVSAAWSPDGSRIAFQNQDRATFVANVEISNGRIETGDVREAIEELFLPGRPTWSGDGDVLALAALQQYSDRFRSGTSQILTVDVDSGEEKYYPPGEEFDSLSTRGDDGPVWSPNGRWMAFVVESTLRVMPIDETGKPTGQAQQITDEATDSPSWSGDSEWILYLNNGRLKMVRPDGSETREIPFNLTYQRDQPSGRTVVYVGRLWDGTSPEVHENVVIEVVNDRIRKVTPDSEPPSGSYVDASELTVIPGLFDSHVHQTYDARFFGDRQGRISLAYGITSTISVGDRVYRAMEDREALAAGERVGPRFFATGEPIDGSRVYYGFIGRPTTSIDQIPLEMSRAIELDYDYMKTYVRLNAERMAAVTETAHEKLGVPAASHYLAPGAFVGQDRTTHLSATQRLGYARTESATSQTYSDIPNLYGQGKRGVTTTFFTADFILANEVENDPRTQLFPPWTREELLDDVGDNTTVPSDTDCSTYVCRWAETFKRIWDHGGPVFIGTDSPLDYVGLGVHENLRPLVEYAFSPYEALLTATRLPAEHLGVDDDLGTVEAGKLADMVFIDGNPLERIEDALQVKMTMTNGDLYSIEDLVEPFESNKQMNERLNAIEIS